MSTMTTRANPDGSLVSLVGEHRILIDVPASMGGSDRGPTPPDLFVASLGSCVAAFVVAYCGRTGLDATDLAVDVDYDKADDPTRLVNLRVTIRLPHAECGDREAAIRRVAEHCPVHESIATFSGLGFTILDKTDLPVLQLAH
jgi:putative redox protein